MTASAAPVDNVCVRYRLLDSKTNPEMLQLGTSTFYQRVCKGTFFDVRCYGSSAHWSRVAIEARVAYMVTVIDVFFGKIFDCFKARMF